MSLLSYLNFICTTALIPYHFLKSTCSFEATRDGRGIVGSFLHSTGTNVPSPFYRYTDVSAVEVMSLDSVHLCRVPHDGTRTAYTLLEPLQLFLQYPVGWLMQCGLKLSSPSCIWDVRLALNDLLESEKWAKETSIYNFIKLLLT
jgi:hypothetical protein